MNIKILDCALKDGYVNIGILQKYTYDNKTLFNDILDFNNILQNKSSYTKYLG